MKEIHVTAEAAAATMWLLRNSGAVVEAHYPEGSISWVTLTGVPRELVGALLCLSFEEFPPDAETADEWITTWNDTPRGPLLRSMYRTDAIPTQKHPYGCRCPECQDCCCCGTVYGQHGGEEHPFVSSGWYVVAGRR